MLFTVIGWGVAFALALFCALLSIAGTLILDNDYKIINSWGWAFCLSMMTIPLAGIRFGKAFDDYHAYQTYTAKEQALRQYEADEACRACCCNKPTCDEVKRE